MSMLSLRQDTPHLAFESINASDFSLLRSLLRDGAQRASEGLSLLFNTPLELEMTGLHTLPFAWLIQQMNDDKRFQTSVHSRLSGDIRGEFYLFLSRNTARNLAQTGLKQHGVGSLFLNPLEESVINELTNILINRLWLTFNERYAIRWWLTPPTVLHRPDNALISTGGVHAFERLALLVEFALVDTPCDLTLFFLPTGDDLDSFLVRLRESEKESLR